MIFAIVKMCVCPHTHTGMPIEQLKCYERKNNYVGWGTNAGVQIGLESSGMKWPTLTEPDSTTPVPESEQQLLPQSVVSRVRVLSASQAFGMMPGTEEVLSECPLKK